MSTTTTKDEDRTSRIAVDTIRRYFRQDVERAILVLGREEVRKIVDEAEIGG